MSCYYDNSHLLKSTIFFRYNFHNVGRIGSETLDFERCIIACFHTFILIYFDFVNRYALCNWWIRTWPTSRCRRPADIIANGKRVTRHSNGFSCKQKRYRRYSAFFFLDIILAWKSNFQSFSVQLCLIKYHNTHLFYYRCTNWKGRDRVFLLGRDLE